MVDSEPVLIECDDATSVAELERSLHERLGRRVPVPGERDAAVGRTLVHGARLTSRSSASRQGSDYQLHVVAGPDAGVVGDLPEGDHTVGRSGAVRWNDPRISRRHLRLRVTGAVVVTDVGSTHGTRIDGEPCRPATDYELAPGAMVEIGNSVVTVRRTPAQDGVWEPAGPGWRRLLRPPRILSPDEASAVEFPAPLPEVEARSLPVATLAVSLMAGAGIALMMRRPEFLIFALVSPMMVLANHLGGRIGARRKRAAQATQHRLSQSRAESQLAAALRTEQSELRVAQPDAAAVLMLAVLPGRRLWERRRADPDFLRIRVGLRDQPSRVSVRGSPSMPPTARLVPQCVNLATTGVLGIVGEDAATDGLLRWVLAQASCGQAPRDLRLVFLGADPGDEWAWLSWLPHLRSDQDPDAGPMICIDPQAIGARVRALSDLIRRREGGEGGAKPVIVVVRGYREVERIAGLGLIINDGPGVGVFVVCTAAIDSELPDATRAVVALDPLGSATGRLLGGDDVGEVRFLVEQVSARWAERVALGLAPFEDAAEDDQPDVPETARLLDLLAVDPGDVESIRIRWRTVPRCTHATVGIGSGGVTAVDLKHDGPHALVAGMTGAGKTEFLQTLIASLAVANHPRWLTFVLIDYKGDSAFRECAAFPHVVGKVNDLDPSLVQRALVSLNAELTHRKELLAEASVSTIEEYHDLMARERQREPLPRLVIVIDEFAELSRELPDFVDGLVTIAQLGRSLGIHLVLATQRPSGVISAAIRANTTIRIALRVADVADSIDVVGVGDAADLPTGRPGRGFLKLGARPASEFQTARIGGQALERASAPGVLAIERVAWGSLGLTRQPPTADLSSQGEVSDLARLASSLQEAARAEGLGPQRQPWLDPLPQRVLWPAERPRRHGLPAGALIFGLSDLPRHQRQELAAFDLDRDGHLFVIGAPRSGRSQVLRTLAYAIAEGADVGDLHLYGLDCGGGALEVLTALPHCGAAVLRSEPDRAARLLARLVAELDDRLRSTDGRPRIVVMVDPWEGFLASIAEHGECVDLLLRLLREGSSAGIHLVVTGDRSLLANARMSGMTPAKYLLRLAETGDYLLAGIPAKQAPLDLPPGRCVGPDGAQTQVFLVDEDPGVRAQEEAIRRVGTAARRRSVGQAGPRPFRVDRLPHRLSVREALALRGDGRPGPVPIVGVGGDELVAMAPDFGRSACFPVIGPPRSGRSSVLTAAAESFRATGGEVAVIRADATHWNRPRDAGPLLLIVDDADEFAPSPMDALLEDVARARVPGVFLLAGGGPALVGRALGGWRSHLARAGQGLLLSPQSVVDGDLIGVRLPRRLVGLPIRAGRGLLHCGDGVLTPVATLLPEVTFPSTGECETVT